ncbi:N-acetyltransferase [Pseudohongiella acticola]|jgi:putative acetyltransferase|uniref:GNAT family N-acetyltransferase n=1 Tax=Pseudohongiella acticola TaxID=1524254 RepID=UPI0030EBC355
MSAQALAISKVAELDGELVGHVAILPVAVSDGAEGWFGLGPISVLPQFQGQDIGTALIKSAMADIEAQGAAGCVVLGDSGYYGRFGFSVVEGLTYPGVPAEYFQAKPFDGRFPQGDVVYHQAFLSQDRRL